MAASSSAEDGAATTDSSINKTWMATFVAAAHNEVHSLVDCRLMDHLWGCNFLPKCVTTTPNQSSFFFFFSAFALDWGRTWLNLKGKRATMHLVWAGLAGCFVCTLKYLFLTFWLWGLSQPTLFSIRFLLSFHFLLQQHTSYRRNRIESNRIAQSTSNKAKKHLVCHIWIAGAG